MAIVKPPSLVLRGTRIAGAAIALFVIFEWTQYLVTIDPFKGFRDPASGPLGGMVGLRMDNVSLKFFHGAQKVGSCRVQRIDVQKNRQYLDLYFVKNGTYSGQNGTFQYRADRAQWNANAQRLQVMSGAVIANADMDLVTDAFEYNQTSNLLYIPDKVRGKLFGGQIVASRLTYSLKNGSYKTGPIEWAGMAALSQEDAGTPAPKKTFWKFKAGSVERDRETGKIDIYAEAFATDGEVIVKAPRIEHNRTNDVLTATGKVLYFSAKANMACDKAVVYRKEKRAVLTGHVQMILKPEKDQKVEVVEIAPFRPEVPENISKDRPPAPPDKADPDKKLDDEVRSTKTIRKYPISILADKIEYWYAKGSRHAVITGEPQARQDLAEGRWRFAWTHEAFYDGEKETLEMRSSEGKKDTHVKTSVGDDYIAKSFTLSTQEDNDWYKAVEIEGESPDTEDEIPKIGGDKKDTGKPGDKKTDDKKGDGGKPPIKGPIGK